MMMDMIPKSIPVAAKNANSAMPITVSGTIIGVDEHINKAADPRRIAINTKNQRGSQDG